MMNSPEISIIMSVYNGERFLCRAIDSILGQTFTDFEFIIIDDGSVDSTKSILTDYAKQDNRIVLLYNSINIGLTPSLNIALKHSRGTYIGRQDADDVSLPMRFEQQIKVFKEKPETVLVSCNLEIIDDEDRAQDQLSLEESSVIIAWHLLFHNYLRGHSQVLFRKDLVMSLGGYAENYQYGQDYELWSRLSTVGNIVIVPDVLVRYRFHNDRISVRNREEQQRYHWAISQNNLSRYVNESLGIGFVRGLSGFWRGQLIRADQAKEFNQKLQQIYNAFIEERLKVHAASLQSLRKISMLISRRFACCAWKLLINNRWSEALLVAKCALSWRILKCSQLGNSFGEGTE